MSVELKEPLSCVHIDTVICNQKEGSQSVTLPVVLINRNGSLVYGNGINYYVNGEKFTIMNNILTYKNLTLELPTKTSYTVLERLQLGLGYAICSEDLEHDIDILDADFKSILHILTMMALKDMKLIRGNFTSLKQHRYGEHIFESYLKAVTGAGTIKSTNKHIRWLNEQDTLQLKAKLFKTSGYQANVKSMDYTPTEIAEEVFIRLFEFLNSISFKQNIIDLEVLDFSVTIAQLKSIRLRDIMLLLSSCIGYTDGFIIRPVLKDTQQSRVYSIFTSISSTTRKILGFTNYDIGSALQTICLQLVDNPSIYPLHQELTEDKIAFRSKIMLETDKDMAWVKKELSKADNYDKQPKKYNHYPTLKAYFQESLKLRKEIVDYADDVVGEIAYLHAKFQWRAVYKEGVKEPEFVFDGKKESSIFFFIWTQYEREIRVAMMSLFDNPVACHQVHDAVYSTQSDVTVEAMEAVVLEQTGFKVSISKD